MMDNTTITFVATLVVAFVFLRWFVNSDESEIITPLDQHDMATGDIDPERAARQREPQRRQVTTDMVEVVQSIAPHLTVSQITYDLQRTGSVQETVERALSEGTLPFPPGQPPQARASQEAQSATDSRNVVDRIKPENLLKKYNVDETAAVSSGSSKGGEWSSSADTRAKTLQEKKAEMILKARKRLEAQLKNEQNLDALTK